MGEEVSQCRKDEPRSDETNDAWKTGNNRKMMMMMVVVNEGMIS
jgi:hypothetical protein